MNTVFSKPGRFWRGNLHTHSSYSDGTLPPEAVCRIYREAGYDFLALTDHFLQRFNWPIVDTTPFRTEQFTTIFGAELHSGKMELGSVWHILAVGLPLDFTPPADDESGPDLARRALEAGAFVAAAHPHWFSLTEKDLNDLGPVHALEIYNGGCTDDNDTAESVYLWDIMLARGRRYTGCATDDAHFGPPTSRSVMMGWVMVKSAELSPTALLEALKAGDYYSSTGPQIFDIQVEPGEKLIVRSSPAFRIFALGIPPEYQSVYGYSLMTAEFDLHGWQSPYVRVLVRDDAGRKAWSNPIWF